MFKVHSNRRIILFFVILLFPSSFLCQGQFLDCASGLLQMPSAEMNQSGTFMITNNFMNSHTVPSEEWGYNTFGYGVDITFWTRLEVYYTCVLFDGKRKPIPSERDKILFNQDRHLGFKFLLLRTGDFGKAWLPNVAVGVNDFDREMFAKSNINNFFTRVYVVASKRTPTRIGEIGAHLGYQFNNWTYYPLSGVIAAMDWKPIWLQKTGMVSAKLIAEYDARTFNVGVVVSLWKDHFEAMIELQAMKWVSAGIRYKVVLKSNNE